MIKLDFLNAICLFSIIFIGFSSILNSFKNITTIDKINYNIRRNSREKYIPI